MWMQDVSLCFSMFKESICAGDTDVALWELDNMSQNNSQRTPLYLTFVHVLHPSMLGSPKATVCWPFLCVMLEAAMTNLSIHSSQEESLNGHAKRDTAVIPSDNLKTVTFSLQCWALFWGTCRLRAHLFTEWSHNNCVKQGKYLNFNKAGLPQNRKLSLELEKQPCDAILLELSTCLSVSGLMSKLGIVLILFMINLPTYCHSIACRQDPTGNQISLKYQIMMSSIIRNRPGLLCVFLYGNFLLEQPLPFTQVTTL